jgi:type II secretory pathway component GspD/PulD (secretin)
MSRFRLLLVFAVLSTAAAAPLAAQDAPEEEIRISARWEEDPIQGVFFSLAEAADRSIVLGPDISGLVTAEIEDQPWDEVLRAVAESHGLVVVESESGIIRIVAATVPTAQQESELLVTRTYRIRYTPAEEMEATLAPLLSDRGRISVAGSTNTIVITDVPRVHSTIAGLLY